MVQIPEGPFWMGVDGLQGLEDERPRHRVWLDTYSLDQYEVTIDRYARFLRETSREAPWLWELVKVDLHRDRPVIGVDWEDADAYCR